MSGERYRSRVPVGVAAPLMSPAAPSPAAPPANPKLMAWLKDLVRVEWSVSLVGILIYIIVIITYKFLIAQYAVMLALLGLMLGGAKVRFKGPAASFTGYWLWAALCIPFSIDISTSTDLLVELGKIGLILLALFSAVYTPRQVRLLFAVYLFCFMLFPVRGVMKSYFIFNDLQMGRAAWRFAFRNPNDLAMFCLLPLAMAMGVIICERGLPRILAVLAAALLALSLLLTQSRGGFIGFAVFLACALVTQKRNRARSIAVGLVLAVVVIMIAPGGIWERLAGLKGVSGGSEMRGVDQEGSAEQRWNIWQTAGEIIKDHPITGVGFGAYKLANAEYSPELGARDSHSTYLNVLAETGLPGLMLFLWLIVVIFRHSRKVRRNIPPPLAEHARAHALLEYALYGVLVCAIWGSFGKMALFWVNLGLLYCSANALTRRKLLLAHQERGQTAPVGAPF